MLILSNVVSTKLSPGLVLVESVNTRWIIFSLQINLCGQQPGSANSGKCTLCRCALDFLGAQRDARERGRRRSEGCGRESPLRCSPWAHPPKSVALNNSFRSWQLTSQLFTPGRKDMRGGMEYSERVQDTPPPPSRRLCHVDYFELKTADTRRTIRHFLFFLEAGDNIPRSKLPSRIRRKKQWSTEKGTPRLRYIQANRPC